MCLATHTNICVANNIIIVKSSRKRPFPCHIRGVAYTKSISCNAEAHARYRNILLASPAKETILFKNKCGVNVYVNIVYVAMCNDAMYIFNYNILYIYIPWHNFI